LDLLVVGAVMADGERCFATNADVEAEDVRLRLIEQASDPRTVGYLDVVLKDVRQSGAPWRLVVLDANQSQGGTGEVAR